jgi:hemerythrin superfamily protein
MRTQTQEEVMADDKGKRGSPDNKRLNKSEPYEVAYARSKRAGATSKTSGKGAPARRSAPARPAPNPPKAEKTTENTAPRTMKEADAVDLLTDDHLRVSALFKQYEKLAKKEAPADQRKTLSGVICAMLKAHTTIEEEIFYPAARAAGVEADLLDEADIEHASAKDLIAQIEAASADSDHYDAKVKVLGDYITHHVVEEHTEMFPKCRRAGMDLVTLRSELESRKMALLPDPGAKAAKGVPAGILTKINQTLFSKA